MAQAAHVRVAQRLLDALGHLPSRHPLPAMDAGLHPLELGQRVVGEVEPTVGEDVALDPAQDAERRQRVVGRRDLLGLPADVVGVRPWTAPTAGRVVADREVVVAALARGAAHLLDARASVRPRRVAVQVAADVGRRDERRRLAAERRLAQLRRAPRQAERGVDGLLVGRVRQRLERLHVRRRPRRPHEGGSRSAPARRRRARSARPRPSPHRAPLGRSTPRRSAAARRSAPARARDPARRRPPRGARRSRASAARRRPPQPPRARRHAPTSSQAV
jgi:hypothetical protein